MRTAAIVCTEKNKLALQEVELGPLEDDEVLVEVHSSFISPGTERWCITGRFYYGGQTDYGWPFVPGYQKAGIALQVGRNVRSVKPGDRVFASLGRFADMRMMWGGHSAYCRGKEEEVIPLPPGLGFHEAAALIIVQVGFNGGSRPPVEVGDVAVVFGDGLIGQFVAQTLRARGAYTIIVGKGDRKRLECARKHSCDRTIDIAQQDIRAELKAVAPSGAQVVVEAIGTHDNTPLACELLAHDGHYVLNGFYTGHNPVDLNPISLKEITVYNPASFTRPRLEKALKALSSGKLSAAPLITHVVKSRDAPGAYRDLVLDRKEFSLGIVIDWSDSR
jgi:2-desacetyl-2-hydroxyethyl bacteriochlorophyllide A dehydrogenase